MSNVQLSAGRDTLDLSHLSFNAGRVGRLKGLHWSPVVAGDSFEMDAVGALRLSPLRRGLAIDSCIDVFTFYIPHRHVYGQTFVDFMKAGVSATPLPSLPTTGDFIDSTAYLGVTHGRGNTIPKFLHQSYLNIYNNYFKAPWMPDYVLNPNQMSADDRRSGLKCCHLKNIWSAPLPPGTVRAKNMTTGATTIDIMGLQTAYAQLATEQERTYFMTRYRDIMDSFGGKTSYDADNRPLLLMRSTFWASGYDVDGTDQSSLGQFSGKIQQPFKHSVPRFFVPEHGTIFTVGLVRFPPVCSEETHFLVGQSALSYTDLACDTALVANLPPRRVSLDKLFRGKAGNSSLNIDIAESQWYRTHPSYVDPHYHILNGFPFIPSGPTGADMTANILVDDSVYDSVFQNTQLSQWNSQAKFNVTVLRNMPTTRDSIMTS